MSLGKAMGDAAEGASIGHAIGEDHDRLAEAQQNTQEWIPVQKMLIKQLATVAALSLLAATSWAKEITCTPAVVQPGDKLVIKISKPFPDFAVITPKKIQGANYFPLTEIGSELVTSAQFAKNRGTVIDVGTAMLDAKNKMFSNPGEYQFLAGMNLETDDGTPTFKCKVRFNPAKKAAAAAPVTAGAKQAQSEPPPALRLVSPAATTAQAAAPKTVDQQLEDVYAKECSPGLVGLLCREKFKLTMCSGKWSDNPAPGESACKNSQRN